MANATYYAHSFSQQVQSLKLRLGTVGPRQEDTEALATDALDLVMSRRLSGDGER
jgi:hypothetical protein